MHAAPTAARQQHKIETYRANCDSYSVFNLLTSDTLLDKVEELMPAVHRERLYPPTETLSMFLTQAMSAVAPANTSSIKPHSSVCREVCLPAAPVPGAICRE